MVFSTFTSVNISRLCFADDFGRIDFQHEVKTAGNLTETTKYGYDHNGNQTYKTKEVLKPANAGTAESFNAFISGENGSSDITLNTFDGFNRLKGTAIGDKTLTYTYNGDGLRIGKTVNGATSTPIWDGDQIALELNSAGAVANKYVRGINLLTAEDGAGTNKKYYLFNGHGDVVQLSGTDGIVTKNYNYDAFGNEKNPDINDTNAFRYSGEYFDKETDTVYLRARYYDPAIGRFLTEDSYHGEANDPLSLNLYVYCANNPILYFDPSGHIPTASEAAEMAEHIYNTVDDTKKLSGGWAYQRTITGGDNMRMGVYSRLKDDGTTEYALVNKGTTPTSGSDWKNNAQQLFGLSDDMKASIEQSKEFVKNHLYNEITMVGHSKGGAEAAANAVATNRNSIIFNPATVNLEEYGLKASDYHARMTAFIVKGDILNSAEGWFSTPIDKAVYLPQQHGGRWYQLWQTNEVQGVMNHMMGAVKKALKEAGY